MAHSISPFPSGGSPLPKAMVVIPTFNERENLSKLSQAILAQGPGFYLLVVDDNSPDGTGDLADQIATSNPRVSVLHRQEKAGLGPAYIEGLTLGMNSDFDFLITMDGDYSHDPLDLERLLTPVQQGADIAIGSRWVKGGKTIGWPLHRQVLSKAGSLYIRKVLGLELHDATGGFRCFRRSALAALDISTIKSTGYSFLIELNYRASLQGLKIVEIPIVFTERILGKSKMSFRIVLEALCRVPLLRVTTRRSLSSAVKRTKLPDSM